MKLSIPFLAGNVSQNIHSKSAASFLITVPLALLVVLAFRIPYSTIFLFARFLLQYLLWHIIVVVLNGLRNRSSELQQTPLPI